jgi:transcriptional regulator with XRE-family HTH domain
LIVTSDLAVQLKRSREARGLSLRSLGRISGFSSSTIHRWETGIGSPDGDALQRLSGVLRAQLATAPPGRIALNAFHRGALLRALRVRSRFSLFDAARSFEFSPGATSRWESGHREPSQEVIGLYVGAFRPTAEEAQALETGQTEDPLPNLSEEELSTMIVRLRELKLSDNYEPQDLSYLAADAALERGDLRLRMQLFDAYIERLEWEYRHREAYQWARLNLELARKARDFNFVGRAVRAVTHQLTTEERKPEQAIAFLTRALEATKGSASEEMVAREAADRMAHAGHFSEAFKTLRQVFMRGALGEADGTPSDHRFLKASIATATGRFDTTLNVLSEADHPDPYMKTFKTQLEAEARHALGDRSGCERVLEEGIRVLDRPGLGHFSSGLVDRLKVVSKEPYRPDLWKWKSSLSRKPSVHQQRTAS